MGSINFHGKKVSSKAVLEILDTIAKKLGNVNVTSGDRDFVPKGGSKTSDHLHHCAADIHVQGMNDKKLFATLASHTKEYFGKYAGHVQLILHGSNTVTGGPHVHIGVSEKRGNLDCMVEGNCAATKGVYAHTTNPEAGAKAHTQVAKHSDTKHDEHKIAAKHADPKHHDKEKKIASNTHKKKKLSAEASLNVDEHGAVLNGAGVLHSTQMTTGRLAEATQSIPNALGAQKDASHAV